MIIVRQETPVKEVTSSNIYKSLSFYTSRLAQLVDGFSNSDKSALPYPPNSEVGIATRGERLSMGGDSSRVCLDMKQSQACHLPEKNLDREKSRPDASHVTHATKNDDWGSENKVRRISVATVLYHHIRDFMG